MPKTKTPSLNKKQMNMLQKARNISAKLKLGNEITRKRLAATLSTLPLTPKKVENALKSLGLAGGKRKTRKVKNSKRMTRRRR